MPDFQEVPANWEPEVLELKAKSIKRDSILGAVVGAAGAFLFFSVILGVVFGIYAIHSGGDALSDINVYGVERKYKRMAQAAQLLGVLAILLSIITIVWIFYSAMVR